MESKERIGDWKLEIGDCEERGYAGHTLEIGDGRLQNGDRRLA